MHFHYKNNESSSAITFSWEEKFFFSYCAASYSLRAAAERDLAGVVVVVFVYAASLLPLLLLLLLLLGRDYDYNFILSLSPVLCCNINMCVCLCVWICVRLCAAIVLYVFVLRAPLIERTKRKERRIMKTIINTHNKIKFLLCFENTWMSLISPHTKIFKDFFETETESTWTRPSKHRCGFPTRQGGGDTLRALDANRKLVTTKTLEGCMYGMINQNLSELSTVYNTYMTQKDRETERKRAVTLFFPLLS